MDNESNPNSTVLHVEIKDYPGGDPRWGRGAKSRGGITWGLGLAEPVRMPGIRSSRAGGCVPPQSDAGLLRIIAWVLNGMDLRAENARVQTNSEGIAENTFYITTVHGMGVLGMGPGAGGGGGAGQDRVGTGSGSASPPGRSSAKWERAPSMRKDHLRGGVTTQSLLGGRGMGSEGAGACRVRAWRMRTTPPCSWPPLLGLRHPYSSLLRRAALGFGKTLCLALQAPSERAGAASSRRGAACRQEAG